MGNLLQTLGKCFTIVANVTPLYGRYRYPPLQFGRPGKETDQIMWDGIPQRCILQAFAASEAEGGYIERNVDILLAMFLLPYTEHTSKL